MRSTTPFIVALVASGLMMAATLQGEPPRTAAQAALLVSDEYRHRLIQQLSAADDKAAGWIAALERCRADQRDALAFLLAHMPANDLKSLSPDRLVEEITLAYQARETMPWGKQVPDAIFLNDVLPYASTSESRDAWRAEFHARFAPMVKDCKTASEAVAVLNQQLFKQLGVQYHATRRQKPDQSPAESIEIGFASCTGLSILLIDACRSVGIPARLVGTPMWRDDSGNHTWVEIWDDGWHYIGAAEAGPLNQTWFTDKAAKADVDNPKYSIYASSFRRTDTPFIAVWAPERSDLYAENVTSRYTGKPQTAAASINAPSTKPATASALDGDWSKMAAITPRYYVCLKTDNPITITGRGDSPAWEQAAWSDDFVDIQGTVRPAPRFRTRVKMLWDDHYLYVFAQLDEPHVRATITQKNQVIFHDNDFEIFIDPDNDHHRYHEFEVNALNTIWELTLPKPYRNGGKPIDPNNIDGLLSAVHVDGTLNDPSDTDNGWSVEVAIPFAGLADRTGHSAKPPVDGQQWRINFSRVEWLADIIHGEYRQIPKAMRAEDNWVWSPQGVIDMHRPERWGYVQFSSSAATQAARPDPTLAARDRLMRIYYRQQTYRKTNGRFAANADELDLTPEQRESVTLTVTADGFVAQVPTGADATHGSLRIDQSSRIHLVQESK